MKNLFVLTVAGALLISPTFAADLGTADAGQETFTERYNKVENGMNWSGCYGQGSGGYAVSIVDTKFNDIDEQDVDGNTVYVVDPERSKTTFVDSLASDDWFAGVGAGCDLRIKNSALVLGVLGGFDWLNSQGSFGSKKLDFNSFDADDGAEYNSDNQWYIGGRVGFLVNSGTLIYVMGAYTQQEISIALLDIDDGAIVEKQSLGKHDIDGYTIGGGVETVISGPLTFTLRYEYSDFGSLTFRDDAEEPNGQIKFDTEQHVVRAGLNYRIPVGN